MTRCCSFEMPLLGLALSLVWCTAAPVAADPAGVERRVDYDYSRGVDQALYFQIPGDAVCDLKKCQDSAQARSETKDQAYEKAFEHIDQMGRTYKAARPHYVEGFKRLLEKDDRSILREDVLFLKAAEIYDYEHKEYKYTVTLAVLRSPRVVQQVDDELRAFLATNVHPETKDGILEFDIADILAKLKTDAKFVDRLKSLRENESFRKSLRFKDDDTQQFIGNIQGVAVAIRGYDRGQYSVNSLIGSIIERAVVPTLKDKLRQYKSLNVWCEGAADSLKITARIRYEGKGRWGTAGQKFSLNSAEGRALEPGIPDNLALSFARGYDGARALGQMLGPLADPDGRIHVFYTGGGVMAKRAGDQPESRRITFRVQVGDKLK